MGKNHGHGENSLRDIMGINYMEKEKEKKKKRNEMTISKDGKKMILLLLKLKGNRIVFIGDLEHSNPLLNFF